MRTDISVTANTKHSLMSVGEKDSAQQTEIIIYSLNKTKLRLEATEVITSAHAHYLRT